MKVEQACRFRLDVGYRTFDQSEGFGPEQEKELGEAFNDTMNSIFPRTGASILSCAVKRSNVFLARNTLRTDNHGRKTIFTHTYSMTIADYGKLMDTAPEKLLGIPMEQFLEYQTGSPLATLDADMLSSGTMDARQLFEKYNLTSLRYKELLAGAYEAITEGKPLCLKTDLSDDETEQMVREIAYCVVLGLPAALKGRLSFSSGADTRMNLYTLAGPNMNAGAGDNVFGVENPQYTRIHVRDAVTDQMFCELAEMSFEDRAQTLREMQAWLNGVCSRNDGVSLQLIAAAYSFTSAKAMPAEAMNSAFLAIAATAGKTISESTADQLLSQLLRSLVEENRPLPKNVMSYVASWYLGNSSEGYASVAEQAMELASVPICLELVAALISNPVTERISRLVPLLLNKIGPQSPELYDTLQDDIILWVLNNGARNLLRFAADMTAAYSPERTAQLAAAILSGADNRSITAEEDALLAVTISRCASGGTILKESVCSRLDACISGCSQMLTKAYCTYFVNVRLNAQTSQDVKLRLLEDTARMNPAFMKQIEETIASGQCAATDIWELYQTSRLFRSDMTLEEIAETCVRCNVFNNPRGPFETKAANLIANRIKHSFAQLKADQSTGFVGLKNAATSLLHDLNRYGLSETVVKHIADFTISEFWNTVSCNQLSFSDFQIPGILNCASQTAQKKIRFCNLCKQLYTNPMDCRAYIEFYQSQQLGSPFMEDLQAATFTMARRLLVQRRFVSWDLLLLTCWEENEKYNMDTLYARVIRFEPSYNKAVAATQVRSRGDDSVLLQNAALRKQVIKQGSYEIPEFFDNMILELKGSKKRPAAPEPIAPGAKNPAQAANRMPSVNKGMQQLPQRMKPDANPENSNDRGGLFGWKGKGNR